MIIRCWGTRGSIPVCGREYLTYGGVDHLHGGPDR